MNSPNCTKCKDTGMVMHVGTWKSVPCQSKECVEHREFLDALEYEVNMGYKMRKERKLVERDHDETMRAWIEEINSKPRRSDFND